MKSRKIFPSEKQRLNILMEIGGKRESHSGYRQTLLGPATSLLPQATYNEKAGACHLSQRSVPRINARRSEGPDEALERKLQVQAPCLRIQLVRSDFPSSVLRSQPRL